MQTNIFSLIDELISMCGNKEDYEVLNSELNLIEEEILNLKTKIDELSSSMTNEKYFDASGEIVDRNIELSVSKKLNKLEKNYDSTQLEQKIEKTQHDKTKNDADSLEKRVNKLKNTIELLNDKVNFSSNSENTNVYFDILKDKEEKLKELEKKREEKNRELEIKTSKIEETNNKLEEIRKEIESSTARLIDVRKSLSEKSNYIDEEMKKNDEENLLSLKNKLNDLEEKKSFILTNSSYIGAEIKNLLVSEENDTALKKLQEIVLYANKKPFMEISDLNIINEELTKLEQEKSKIINLIENKDYNGKDILYLNNRIKHLEKLIKSKKDKIDQINSEIQNIDNTLIIEVNNELKNAEKEAEILEQAIKDYHLILESKDKKSSNTLIALQSTYTKKQNELEIIYGLIESYSKEFNDLIIERKKLEEKNIQTLEYAIKIYEEEIEELKKLHLLSSRTKDAIALENDKNELKQISEKIETLKQRLKFSKTPQELYDQIEMLLSSEKTSYNKLFEVEEQINQVEEVEKETTNPEFENNSYIEEISNKDNNEESAKTLEKTLFEEFYEYDDSTNNKSEDLNANINKKMEENSEDEEEEYTFSELEDTNYFNLEDFLKKLDSEKNE